MQRTNDKQLRSRPWWRSAATRAARLRKRAVKFVPAGGTTTWRAVLTSPSLQPANSQPGADAAASVCVAPTGKTPAPATVPPCGGLACPPSVAYSRVKRPVRTSASSGSATS